MPYTHNLFKMFMLCTLWTWASSQAVSLTIANESAAGVEILIDGEPHETERFAAEELVKYVEAMTRTRLSVNSGAATQTAYISVGATRAAHDAGLVPDPRYPEDDTYRIVERDGNLYLAGATPRGTLFAVYDLLERLGCRWFAPAFRFYKNMHEHVPRVSSLEVPDTLDVLEVPALKYRAEFCEHFYLHEPDDVVALVDWCAKNRINLLYVRLNEFSDAWYRVLEPPCRERSLLLAAEAHGFERFLPRARYFPDNPEWFGPVRGEYSDNFFDQFTVSNPDALAAFTENLADFVRRYPYLYSVSAMPNDSQVWTDPDMDGGNPVDLLFQMYDVVVRTVWETDPAMKVSIGVGVTYFGQSGLDIYSPPHPNVIWHTAVLRRTQRYAWNDPASALNAEQYEKALQVTQELRAQGQDVIWSSRYAPFRDLGLPGLIYPTQMADELADLVAIDGSGIDFNYAVIPCWIPYELKHYLFARLAWNPNQDAEAILGAYYRDRFPGSPEEMAAFYTALRSAMERYPHPGGGYSREEAFGVYPAEYFDAGREDFATAQHHLDRAMASNPNDSEKQLIWLLDASLQFGKQKFEIDYLAQHNREDEAAERVVELMDYLESWTNRGVVYDSSFLRMGLERRFLGRPQDVPIKLLPSDNTRVYEFKNFLRSMPQVIPGDTVE